ncbi:hypothetical protein FGO68_gene5946 [Halteria grandinella]|uniref:Uncharacterized protein n=1 Tax=Halteria grandinella TaxID=5974 RepID=A0A8J8NY27_HALGN|nr:hypothetical protein FGO68_gene5946 [Halteria grandinella]
MCNRSSHTSMKNLEQSRLKGTPKHCSSYMYASLCALQSSMISTYGMNILYSLLVPPVIKSMFEEILAIGLSLQCVSQVAKPSLVLKQSKL